MFYSLGRFASVQLKHIKSEENRLYLNLIVLAQTSESTSTRHARIVVSYDEPFIKDRCFISHLGKVRAFLDYYGFSYEVVEVNPVTRSQINFSKDYKKVVIFKIINILKPSILCSHCEKFHPSTANGRIFLNYISFNDISVTKKENPP